MKKCNKCNTVKSRTSFYRSKYYGLRSDCKDCCKLSVKLFQKKNPEKRRKYQQQTYLNNRDHYLTKSLLWAKINPAKANARNMKYITKKIQALPPWLSIEQLEQIVSFYKLAQQKTKETGIKHEVDHIIPLNGKLVSGLHVPWNLQVITKIENIKKRNRIIYE